MGYIADIYKSINAVSEKVNDAISRLNRYTDYQDKINKTNINDVENALIEVDEDRLQAESDAENALIELDETIDERLADIENALCELSEQEG